MFDRKDNNSQSVVWRIQCQNGSNSSMVKKIRIVLASLKSRINCFCTDPTRVSIKRILFGYKYDVLSFMIFSLFILQPSFSNAQQYNIIQNNQMIGVTPIIRSRGVVDFYGYSSASAHTPFVEPNASKIYFYINSSTGGFNLIIHHGQEGSGSEDQHIDFDFDSIPDGAFVVLSDDDEPPNHAHEFSLNYEPEGNWFFGNNTDGGILRIPSTFNWIITITPNFLDADSLGAPDITEWIYQEDNNEILLSMTDPLKIIYFIGCEYLPGDVNSSGNTNGLDVVYLVNYLKGSGNPPIDTCMCPPNENFLVTADANGSCTINGLDVIYLVGYFKGEHPTILYCVNCAPME